MAMKPLNLRIQIGDISDYSMISFTLKNRCFWFIGGCCLALYVCISYIYISLSTFEVGTAPKSNAEEFPAKFKFCQFSTLAAYSS